MLCMWSLWSPRKLIPPKGSLLSAALEVFVVSAICASALIGLTDVLDEVPTPAAAWVQPIFDGYKDALAISPQILNFPSTGCGRSNCIDSWLRYVRLSQSAFFSLAPEVRSYGPLAFVAFWWTAATSKANFLDQRCSVFNR